MYKLADNYMSCVEKFTFKILKYLYENEFGNSYISLQKFKGDPDFDNSIRSQLENGNIETNKENSMNSESKNYSYRLTPKGYSYIQSKQEIEWSDIKLKTLGVILFFTICDFGVDAYGTRLKKEIVTSSTIQSEDYELKKKRELKELELEEPQKIKDTSNLIKRIKE